jgi:hypothetical protein
MVASAAGSGMESPLSKTARRLRESRSKSLLNIECFDVLCTREGMQEFLKQKFPMPHHSQLNGGKFELLSVDDDPINQVDNMLNLFSFALKKLSYVGLVHRRWLLKDSSRPWVTS